MGHCTLILTHSSKKKKANRVRNYLRVMGQFDVGIHWPLKTKINQNQLQYSDQIHYDYLSGKKKEKKMAVQQ
jgi:hypothetical protein